MPQTNAEKKFFGKIIAKTSFGIRSILLKSIDINDFQGYEVFQKNITGGKE